MINQGDGGLYGGINRNIELVSECDATTVERFDVCNGQPPLSFRAVLLHPVERSIETDLDVPAFVRTGVNPTWQVGKGDPVFDAGFHFKSFHMYSLYSSLGSIPWDLIA